jgi:hypothetical protein
MNSKILLFTKNDLKIILLITAVGGIFQLICSKYIDEHLELFKDEKIKKLKPTFENKKLRLPKSFPRDGAFVELTGSKVIVNIKQIVIFAAKKAY